MGMVVLRENQAGRFDFVGDDAGSLRRPLDGVQIFEFSAAVAADDVLQAEFLRQGDAFVDVFGGAGDAMGGHDFQTEIIAGLFEILRSHAAPTGGFDAHVADVGDGFQNVRHAEFFRFSSQRVKLDRQFTFAHDCLLCFLFVLSFDSKKPRKSLHGDQFIFTCADAELFGMLQLDLPVRRGRNILEMIMMATVAFAEDAGHQRGHLVDGVRAGLVKSHGIERGEHADVRDDRRVVFRMAVAERRDVHDDADMEMRAAFQHGPGVFRHLLVQRTGHGVVACADGVLRADGDALAAADAFVMIDDGLAGAEILCAMRADFRAKTAADALLGVYERLAVAMLFHFTRSGAAAHADVLDGAAEARHFMAFEMRQ